MAMRGCAAAIAVSDFAAKHMTVEQCLLAQQDRKWTNFKELKARKKQELRARMLSLVAAARERKRKRDDDSQVKEDTKPPLLRHASGEEAQPDPELKDVGESGSFAAAVATKEGADWTDKEVNFLYERVEHLFDLNSDVCVTKELSGPGHFDGADLSYPLHGQLDDVQHRMIPVHVDEKKPAARNKRQDEKANSYEEASDDIEPHASGVSQGEEPTQKTVAAPPGILGLRITNIAESKGTVISDVRSSSVLADKISPGDRIIAIDGEDVSLMTRSEIGIIMAGKSDLERQLTIRVPSPDHPLALAEIRQGQAPTSRHPDEPSMLIEQSDQQQPKPTPDPAPMNTKGEQVECHPPAISPTSVECTTLNPTMNPTSPVNDTSPPATEDQPDIIAEGQPPIDMNQPVEQESHATMMPWTGVRGWLLLLASLAIVIALRAILGRSRQITSPSTLKLVLPPCFLSSSREESEEEEAVFGWCDNSKGPDPCPHGGICSEGELRSCMGSYLRVSENGDQCVLSAASNKTIASVEAILAKWTTKHYCALTGNGWGTIVDVSAPSFELSHLVENVNIVTPLLLTSNSFDVRPEKNGMIMIGLTEGYIQARSVIPCSCRFRISVIQFLEYIEKPMLRAMFYVWFILKSCPLASVLCFVMWAVCGYQRWQVKRRN